MKKMNAMEMRNVEGGAKYYTVKKTCDWCGKTKSFKSRIWVGLWWCAKYKATKAANNWLYNHGCWN